MLCLCRPNNAMLHGLPNVTALLGGLEPRPREAWLMGSTGLCTVGEPGGGMALCSWEAWGVRAS